MATIYTSFVGVDKHLDSGIRELTGARRDALALHSLFKDTLPEIGGSLLINEDATLETVRASLVATLGQATSDDVVIFSFSGHGTRDHRLVMHDTYLSDLENTTLPMEELANLFRRSSARAILCILDCCFSGGAPAKVLENSPVSRSVIGLQELAGEGRVLIAASKESEPAYEFPSHRQGLLTKALVDVLQGEGRDGDTIELLSAGGSILERVRAEAARLGVSQTPVFLGNIVGGLVLPRLKRGDLYRAAFPEYHGILVSSNLEDLAAFGLRREVLEEWSSRFSGLNNLQLTAVNEFRVLDGDSLLVVAPTSSGKTFIGEMASIKAVHEGRKAVFLLPYKALVNEKYESFTSSYSDKLDLRVVRCTGDHGDQTGLIAHGQYDLALLTYEMFLNLSGVMPHVLQPIGLVVVDEAQFITDSSRGINLELLLTSLIAARERGLVPQIIALSAVIGDVNGFHEWLRTRLLVTYERPVPLQEGVLERSGILVYKDEGEARKTMQFLPRGSVYQRRDKPQSQDLIVPLVAQLVSDGEKVLIFRNAKGPTQGCAQYLANSLGLVPATDVIAALPESDRSSTSEALRSCLAGGTAFHNTNLNAEERAAVERSFRDPDGRVRVLVATTTLAAGINTPADTVILAEMFFKGEKEEPFTVSEYKNMAGRAGRLGYKTEGKSIIIAQHSIEQDRFFQHYVLGSPEALRSSFDPNQIETWIVRLLAQVKRVPRNEVATLLTHTYGGYLLARRDPTWGGSVHARIDELLRQMLQLGLLEEEDGVVSLTLLGKACGNSPLSFRSVLRLVESLRALNPDRITPLNLVAVTQSLLESDAYTPLMKKGNKDQVWPSRVLHSYGSDIVRLLQRGVNDEFIYYARAKRVSILSNWVHGVPLSDIERAHTVNPFYPIEYGNIRGFSDTTRFLLRSVANIANLLSPSENFDVEPVLKQLEFGLPDDALALVDLPIPLTRGEYLALWQAGLVTPEQVLESPEDRLSSLLGKQSLVRLAAFRRVGNS
ncbi:MAG TPA: DEAD/DEAH box helicase [Thermoanaerobaculia bacterium]|nr:DEAD/DEAH box helicase [Thermoanaerobaculia bacterium]